MTLGLIDPFPQIEILVQCMSNYLKTSLETNRNTKISTWSLSFQPGVELITNALYVGYVRPSWSADSFMIGLNLS